MRVGLPVLVVALVTAACGNPAQDRPAVTSGAATTLPATTVAAPASATTARVPPAVTTGTIRAPEPLLMGISVHVEGYHREAVEDAQYEPHRTAVLNLARIAEEEGARLSFELSRAFVEGAGRRGDDVVAELQRRGHAVGVHADVGGEALALDEFVAELRSRRVHLEQLGADVSHVSGICSAGPWVEAAIGAGYESATGFVEFCLKSLARLPPGFEHVAACETPRDCHGAPVVDPSRKMRPWRSSSAADWLTPDPGGELVMIAGDSAETLQCLAEDVIGNCSLDEDDVAAFASLIGDYIAARGGSHVAVATVSWSIGTPPPEGFARSLFAAVARYVADGEAVWATLPEMAAALP